MAAEVAAATPGPEPSRPEFDEWLETFNGFSLAKGLRKRPWLSTRDLREKFAARRKEFSYDDLILAAMYLHDDAHMCGSNDSGKVYATPEYILRNPRNVQKYLEPPKPRSASPPRQRPPSLHAAGG